MTWALLVLFAAGSPLPRGEGQGEGAQPSAVAAASDTNTIPQNRPEGSAATPPPSSSTPVEHGALNTLGLVSSTTGVLAVSTGAALVAGLSTHFAPFAVNGRPNPWVSNGGMLVMLGVQFAIAHLLVPQIATWWRPEHDVIRVREKAWEFSRWPLAAGALGALTYTVGAVLEETRWGRGDAVMAAGLLTTVLSLFVFDVIEGLATLGAVR
ncbi:MAG: hypothetical protein JNM17_13295 [Archangium sp.]|nr:hypothetical protein [Archangium sp.]